MSFNLKMLDYALHALFRRAWQRVATWLIFSILVFLLISIFSIAGSLEAEQMLTLDPLPELIVQKMSGGRQAPILAERAYEIATIPGVANASPRVWGYYYFNSARVNFTVIGTDLDLPSFKPLYTHVIQFYTDSLESNRDAYLITGAGVKDLMHEYGYEKAFNFISATGRLISLPLIGSFTHESALESNDIMLIPEDHAREIFDLYPEEATDIIVSVPNPEELEIIKQKIQFLYPDCRIISKTDLTTSYTNLFNYKTGFFLALLVTSFMALFTMVVDKGSGISMEERREIGIMKAVGWRIKDILFIKFAESLYVTLLSHATGISLSFMYVYVFNAPLLRDIFVGPGMLKPNFDLIVHIDIKLILLTFLAIVPVYIMATIIPAWRSAIIDADEVMR